MGVRRHHVERQAMHDEHVPADEIDGEKIKPGTLNIDEKAVSGGFTDLTKFGASTIEIALDVPMRFEAISLAADAVGVVEMAWEGISLLSQHIKHLKSAQFIVSYAWAATADGTIQLFDATANAVIAESTTKTGGETAALEAIDVTGDLIAGNWLDIRLRITVAGAAGETVTLYRMWLRLILGIS